jgi:hypothetical protein
MPQPTAAGVARLQALNHALADYFQASSACAARIEALLLEAGGTLPKTRQEE